MIEVRTNKSVTDGQSMKFDLITAWELIEHLPEAGFRVFCQNVLTHLDQGGLFVASISTTPDREWHRTVKPRVWWLRLFDEYKLQNHPEIVSWFRRQFVRGARFNAGGSFHVALTRTGDPAPRVPAMPFKETLIDLWHFSKPHRILREIVVGRK